MQRYEIYRLGGTPDHDEKINYAYTLRGARKRQALAKRVFSDVIAIWDTKKDKWV